MNPPHEKEKIQSMTPGKVPVGLVGFLRHPNENLKADYRPGGLLRTVCWWAGVQVFFAIAMALLITFDLGQGGAENTTRASMPPEGVSAKAFLWLLIFLPPVLEEFLFRYPLRRTRWVLTLWSAVAAYLLVSALAGVRGLEPQGLLWRLALGGAVGLAVGLGGWRYALKINFGGMFYFSAAVFALLHLSNLHGEDFQWIYLPYLLVYTLDKFASGLVFGYARMRHGFGAAVVLHVLSNLFFVI